MRAVALGAVALLLAGCSGGGSTVTITARATSTGSGNARESGGARPGPLYPIRTCGVFRHYTAARIVFQGHLEPGFCAAIARRWTTGLDNYWTTKFVRPPPEALPPYRPQALSSQCVVRAPAGVDYGTTARIFDSETGSLGADLCNRLVAKGWRLAE